LAVEARPLVGDDSFVEIIELRVVGVVSPNPRKFRDL
jgi:hypothetical protein